MHDQRYGRQLRLEVGWRFRTFMVDLSKRNENFGFNQYSRCILHANDGSHCHKSKELRYLEFCHLRSFSGGGNDCQWANQVTCSTPLEYSGAASWDGCWRISAKSDLARLNKCYAYQAVAQSAGSNKLSSGAFLSI